MATTEAAIRARMQQVIRELVPAHFASDRFDPFLNENAADFRKWCEENIEAAFRRFQVRTSGADQPPTVSSVDIEERQVTVTIIIAYPQDSRVGDGEAIARDDLVEEDRFQIDHATGMCGRANFSGSFPDACWIGTNTPDREVGAGVDFLVITHTLIYVRQY